MASSEDAEAQVKVLAKQAVAKGHRYGPFKGKLVSLANWDEQLQMGSIKIPSGDPNLPGFRFDSNDFTIPMWIRFIKPAESPETQTLTIVQVGFKYFFEVTKDVSVGTEHFILGRKMEDVEIGPDGNPVVKRRGRPRKPKLTPEQLAAMEEEKKKKLEEKVTEEKELKELPEGVRGRSRKCVICGKKFISSALFMQHRQTCGTIKQKDIYEDVEEDEEDEEIEDEDEEESLDDKTDVRADGLVKRPRGRPRKDGQPPQVRKRRGRKRKVGRPRKRPLSDSDEETKQIKYVKDECNPTPKDKEKYPFECDMCENNFPTQTWLDFHKEHHTSPALSFLVCTLCDEAFRFLTSFNGHLDEKHSELDHRARVLASTFRCDACKKQFRSPIHLERHRQRASQETPYPKGPVQIKCKFCEKSFTGEVSLENHTIRKHPERKQHQCTENNCEETFQTKEERASHLETVHGTDPKLIYRCPVENCIKAYTSMSALNYHYELRHTTNRPFTCEICGKTWVKLGKLRDHLKTHSTEKNELCDLCGRAFKTRAELKDHKSDVHSEDGREKISCRYCTATFSRRSSRSYHERRHRNDTPYVCPKPGCNKSFVAVIDFKRHLIYHTGAKLYRCRYCSNCFTRSDYLKGHERRHHLRGEQIVPGPPIEETVTIKVPWPMEKPVKIQGQNVVVIIEPDPTLAAGELTTEALAALERAAEGHVINQDGMHIQMSADQQPNHPVGIVEQATQPGIQSVDTTASQLLQLAAEQATATTSSGGLPQSQGEIVTTSLADGTLDGTQILMQAASQQALLQQTIGAEGTHISMSGEDGSQITMDTATSEQAALVLQQLAGENAQIVMQPSEDGTLGTMHATLQNEDGETSIVMVSLTPEQLANANGVTITEGTAGGAGEGQTLMITTDDVTVNQDGTFVVTSSGNIPSDKNMGIVVTEAEHGEVVLEQGGEAINITEIQSSQLATEDIPPEQ
ncbi:hypothetical protein HOLleu_39346 [Holothuria leucospilota]|uniref:C2H2-type domain-containing protein n=1 Tax=Holothuria leucospilota TaxID=206669 RepID=A0A9Q0YI90_HOLLE|nr:hypothetical protein HOLleu_39346 [Holothuria leucospilota]